MCTLLPQGFGKDEAGNRTGYNTDVYSEPEIERIARVGFEAAQKRSKRLCSVEKSNVLEVSQLWKEVRRAAQRPTHVHGPHHASRQEASCR